MSEFKPWYVQVADFMILMVANCALESAVVGGTVWFVANVVAAIIGSEWRAGINFFLVWAAIGGGFYLMRVGSDAVRIVNQERQRRRLQKLSDE